MKKSFLSRLTVTLLSAISVFTVGGFNSMAAEVPEEVAATSTDADISEDTETVEAPIGNLFASYDGYKFYKDSAGNVRCYNSKGAIVKNDFKSDGTYTYFFQNDGTCMKDRLTYHPDGVHVIYFDGNGHEVFSDFANVKKTITGQSVDDLCFFNVFGYMYVDVVTYDKTGTKLYYANQYGVMERKGWFYFSEKWGGGLGCANSDGSLMTNTNTYYGSQLVFIQGDGNVYGTSKLVARFAGGGGKQVISNLQIPNGNYKVVTYITQMYDSNKWSHYSDNFIIWAKNSKGYSEALIANELTGNSHTKATTLVAEKHLTWTPTSYGGNGADIYGGSFDIQDCNAEVKWEMFIYAE